MPSPPTSPELSFHQRQVLEFIRQRPGSTVDKIWNGMNIRLTPESLRKHLKLLVDHHHLTRTKGPGKSGNVYSIHD